MKRSWQHKQVYDTARWRSLRRAILDRDPLCVICLAAGTLAPATVVDHIKPLTKGGDPWLPSNLRGCCKRCHDELTTRVTRRRMTPEMAEEEAKWRAIVDSPID